MRLWIRMFIIGLISLFIGIAVNQFHPRGLRWRMLMLSVPDGTRKASWNPMSTEDAFAHFLDQTAVFVDIRPREEYDMDHIPCALSVPFYKFFNHPDDFRDRDKSANYILYDFKQHSDQARMMAQQLLKFGFQDVYFLRNGYPEWIKYGFPLDQGGVE